MTLPHIDDDGDEEMEIDEDAVEKICDHVDMRLAGGEDNNTITEEGSTQKGSEDTYVKMEEGISEQFPLEEKKALSSSVSGLPDKGSLSNLVRRGSSCPISDPLATFSREISREDMPDESRNGSVNCVSPSCLSICMKSALSNAIFTQTRRNYVAKTEHLATSLHHGLEIIDNHHRSSRLRMQLDVKEGNDGSNLWLLPFDDSQSVDKSMKQVPKAVEKVLAGAIRREMALEDFCAKQTSEIKHLNRLVQQYKHVRECNAIIGQTREDKILRLEGLYRWCFVN
ncbi:hypothetical protein Patl1_18625 [Pistacia atlantica]|uniref:Uncharacterized protein n=1 Tax=Pistacia atlantica TaxID=434234 RepID=A0ACC1C0G9_9ROSI|nr:hypothetical protein Patl1_18625 [Pistacia atlantica]